MRKLSKLILSLILLVFLQTQTKAQTTLAAGDLAFSGYVSGGNGTTISDRFSFVLLTPVTANTVIKFTDYGWRTDLNAFSSGASLESEYTLTISGALPAGTEIHITNNNITGNPTPTATLVGGGSAGTIVVSVGASFLAGNMAFSTTGDQLFAYQGTFASPVFISGIHKNAYNTLAGDPSTTSAAAWDGVIAGGSLNTNSSGLPAGLTTGTNAIWIGAVNAISPFTTEWDNAFFACGPDVSTAALARAALNNQANWTKSDGAPAFTLPTGCNYLGVLSAPTINTNPSNSSICEGAGTSFTITATNALTYQWQVDNGGGYANITDNANYSGATTATLTLTNVPASFNGYLYRCVATNGVGSANSTGATLTVTALPVNPTLLAKTPNTATVADGTPVSATFNAGSGGTGCTDDFRYTTNGGASYLPYTPGSNISTTGLAAGTGVVTIEGRRAGCATCSGNYIALATWIVTPLPAAATTLNAGDIAFSGYISAAATDEFSFVLLRNIGPGTTINFTDNGWLSTNVFATGETTVTWTSNAAYGAGTEIHISGLTATLASGGSAGTVTGTALSLSTTGDQILAYRGTAASPTFISAIHMNVFTIAGGDPVNTTAAAWDGTATGTSASALPTGLTTGVNCIWIGTQGVPASEFENARYGTCSNPATLGAINTLRAALNNQANWTKSNGSPAGFTLPTGCSYLGLGNPPNITVNPANSNICEGANTSFSITAGGATSYQWQVDNGGGFANITNNATYSGATTATLTINAAPLSLNGYLYRCIATNGSGSSTSTSATLTVSALPVGPTLLAKTPAGLIVADGTPVSATFNPGSGGTGCSDDFRYTTDGGATYLPYTPGSNISTTGLAAGSGYVFIEGRRANCSAGCQGNYTVLALWRVSPLPAAPTTLNAGDIGFTAYTSTSAGDDFSFVLLKNIGAGTTINFTNNGWLSTNVFRTGEETVTWTAPAGGLYAGTEITISGLTATRSGGGAAGTVTGTALNLSTSGDQILAYRGTAASPTFISAIHMNVYSVANGDPVTTTAAAWDGTANTTNSSALPTGLTTGVNCIWIGTQDVPASEFDNSRYGNCAGPGVLGPLTGLRAALNNQANWISNNLTPPGFTQPVGCNFLQILVPSISVTGTPLAAFTACEGTPSAEQNFSVSGSALTGNISINAPAGFEISLTSGSGFASNLSLTQSGGVVPATTIYVRVTAAATGTPSGNIVLTSAGATTVDVAVSATVSAAPTTAAAGADASNCGLTYTLNGNIPTVGTGTWTYTGPGTATFVNANLGNTGVTVSVQGAYTFTWTISTGGGCPPSADDVIITFAGTPTTANAGADRNLCQPSTALNMAANTPAIGTGTWTQTGGPVTAGITNVNNPTTSITGLTQAGVYTFVWTISNAPCTPSTDEMTITVAAPPAVFNVVGANACQGTTITLTGPADPNYSYQWLRSFSGITGSYVAFGGTAQTQAVTTSGNYQLIVTNLAGCTASDTAVVHISDYVFNGSIAAGDPSQTGRINRFAVTSVCPGPKAFPGMFVTSGARLYDSYTITNIRSVPVCATIGIASGCGVNVFNVAYTGSFNPADPSQNYLGDPGSSFPSSGFMEVTIPANGTIVVVVHEVNPGTGCANYRLTVDVPRDPAGITVSPTPPVCSGTPTTLTAPVANTYLWNPGGATTQAINVTPTTTTNYDVTLGYGNNGCTNNISTSVTVNPVVTANAGPDDATCGLTYPAFAANTPAVGTGAWSQVSGPGTSTFTNANSPTSGVTVTANGVYVFRWTVTAGAPCPGSAQDDVQINFAGDPSTANAGTDKTACVSPGTTTMTATAPTVGTGVWTQVAGPVTANIISPALFNTTITGLNTTGTYTFRWTVSNAPCNANFDDVDVVVNSNPPVPTITGGGTFCPPGTTLAGPVDPNYTYQWGRSYLAAPFTGLGTGQTQAVTASGNYQLTVTNQFGCSASAVTVVNVADYVFNGSLGAGDAQQTGRLNRFAQISTCASPKACPGTFTTTGARFYDAYTITNPRNVPVCATIGLNSGCGTAVFSVAYSGSFNPTALCTNYLADPGSSPAASIFYEVTIPANGTIVVVVHEVNPGQGCANYTLTVDVPRDLSPINANPPSVVCNGTSTLTAPVANSYLWSPGGQTTQSIVTPPLFVPTNFSVTLGYGNNGCTRSDNVTVGVTSLPPTVTCPGNITQANDANQCGAIVTYTTTVGGLPAPTVTYAFTGATTGSGNGDGSGSFFNVGTTNVTVTVTNSCGTTSCSFTVTVNDTQNPTITCPAPVTVSCASAVPAPNIASVTAGDNCPGVTVTHISDVISAQTCANRYTVTRTYRATDAAGNFSECTQIITVNDQTPPVVTCPAPVTVSCAAAVPAPNTALVTATDNCAGAITITHISDVISAQTCANRYTITRTYRATDVCGNFAECTQIITVNDQTPPVITCPAPVTVSCAAAVPAPNTSLVTATDNCAGTITITHISDVISAQTCANRYTVTRTYRATDVCGNFAECTQIITVNDQTPPVITCPAPVTVSCAAAVPAPNTALVTATDNCAGAITITHISDVISNQTCANRYTITRTYRATDVCGNFAQCTQIITVNDQTPPVITCPAAITVSCASAVPAPNTALVTATDNCAGVITITHISDVITNQTCPNRYTLTRTYRATDVCGNFSECTQVITVNDNIAPVITCPAPITVTTPFGSCVAVVNFAATATDNCGGVITYTYSHAPGSSFPIGTTTVTATATDVCGNSSSCTFTITVIDAQAPVITQQPQNRTVCVGQNATFTVAAITSPTAGGPLSYQWQQWNGSAWVNIAGATGTSHTVSSVTLAMNTNTFRVVVTGLCTTINSNAATLFVNPLPTISLTASPLIALLPNQTTSINATVNPAGGSFVWSLNGSPLTGVTGPTVSPININGIGTYTAVYTDLNGCVSATAQITIGAQFSNNLWVYPNPNTGTFNVRFYNQTGEQVTVKVYNAGGQEVFSQALTLGITYSNITVNLGNAAAGVYLVKVINTSGLEIASRRIVVYH